MAKSERKKRPQEGKRIGWHLRKKMTWTKEEEPEGEEGGGVEFTGFSLDRLID